MPDDVRRLVHAAGPGDGEPRADFDGLWARARRQRRLWQTGGVAAAIVVLGAAVLGVTRVPGPATTLEVSSNPGECPVTIPDGDFVPPAPYPAQPSPPGSAWYGTSELWTVLDVDGDYTHRKSVWWSADFEGGAAEQQPKITVTWERPDAADQPVIDGPAGTNASTAEDGSFMIAGIDPDVPGCWRVTATYRDAEISYVYEATPASFE